MLILVAIFILFLASFFILGLNRSSLRPGYFWFLAVGTTLAAWFLVLFAFPTETVVIDLLEWESSPLFFTSPSLLLDLYSWPFAVAITTMLAAVLLTDAARVWDIRPAAWGGDLAITAAGLLAVFAANPLTLLLAWAVIDLVETVTMLNQVTGSHQREQVVVSFSVRVVGMLLVISAIIRAQVLGVALLFWDIPKEVSGYLILAAGLRLGVLPPHPPFLQEPPLRRGLGTLVRLVPVAASLVLLTRVAIVGASPLWEFWLTISSALALLYGGIGWLFSQNELDGRPFWIFGMSAMAVMAAIRALPSASLAWGLGLLISGALLFLYSTRRRRYVWIPILGLLIFSGLPFTPAWEGTSLFAGWHFSPSIVFSLGYVFLILGYFRHSFREMVMGDEIESWARVLYPVGLVLLPIGFTFMAILLGWLNPAQMDLKPVEWWLGGAIISVAAGIWFLFYRGFVRLPWEHRMVPYLFSFRWLFQMLWRIYRSTSKLVIYVANLLEGQGGVFWAVMVLILLVTFILQRAGGG